MAYKKRSDTDPLRNRLAWWTEPGAIILFVSLVVGGICIALYAHALSYKNVVIIIAVIWPILTGIMMMLYKRSQYESRTYVKERVVERTKEGLVQDRVKVREEFIGTELAVLERGEATTVFDSWRFQPAIQESHPYFPRLDLTEIDPSTKELHIRVQLKQQYSAITAARGFEQNTLAQMLRFLRLVSGAAQVKALAKFFDLVVLELYALREDEEGRDHSYPFFSLSITKTNLAKLVSTGHVTLAQLQKFAEARFDGGKEIEPHRHLPPGAAQRGK
jgi:hypothetical protein